MRVRNVYASGESKAKKQIQKETKAHVARDHSDRSGQRKIRM
jgi:hypothetical protein